MSHTLDDLLPARVVLGGIGYRLSTTEKLSLRFANAALNRVFVSDHGAADHVVGVEVTASDLNPLDGAEPLFDTGVAWSMSR